MVTRSFSYDGWQEIMDALPAEQSDLEDHIANRCDEIDTNPIHIEMTAAEGEIVDRLAKELWPE